jgi:hypothetical protein
MQSAKSPDTQDLQHNFSETIGLGILTVEGPEPLSLRTTKSIFSPRQAVCRCGWSRLHRSRTLLYQWPLKLMLVLLRCERCQSRFWRTRLRRIPFVWFDSALDVFSALKRSPVFVGLLIILVAAAMGALLGCGLYALYEIGRPDISF